MKNKKRRKKNNNKLDRCLRCSMRSNINKRKEAFQNDKRDIITYTRNKRETLNINW